MERRVVDGGSIAHIMLRDGELGDGAVVAKYRELLDIMVKAGFDPFDSRVKVAVVVTVPIDAK